MFWVGVITPPPIGERNIVMSVSVCVCVCVCLSVRDLIFGTTRRIFTIFMRVIMAVIRSSSGGVVICYVGLLSVLWVTSYLHISLGCSTSPPSWGAAHAQRLDYKRRVWIPVAGNGHTALLLAVGLGGSTGGRSLRSTTALFLISVISLLSSLT